ncbi:MAG: ABC transporter permease, partial [Acidobacteriaceae bacterium]|nr:ABC transporter permease [Acidobacteriaceae bacterium]
MPDWEQIARLRLRPLHLTGTAEADFVREVAQHLEDFYADLLSGGAAPEAAYRTTLAELDDLYPLRASLKGDQIMPKQDPVPAGDLQRANFFEDFWRDVKYAARTMRKSPLFVTLVVLILGLGIGANTTVFTLINTLILNPLPVHDPASLAAIQMVNSVKSSKNPAPVALSYANLKDFQSKNGVFDSLAGYTVSRLLTGRVGTVSERLFGEFVTGTYFATLGLTPAAGRFFLPDEDSTPGGKPVAVLNYATWQTHFGGARDIVGRTLEVNHVALTVIGVAPPRFIGVNGLFGPDLWIPATMAEQLLPHEMSRIFADRSKELFLGVGRLKPGVTLQQVQANLGLIAADLAREYPGTNEGRTTIVRPIRDVLFAGSLTSSAPVMAGTFLLLIVVGIVLLIACSNIANLLLARSAARQQEISVRLAIGASRPRLIRQLLTESVIMGLLSAALGLLAGYASLQLLTKSLPGTANFITPKF